MKEKDVIFNSVKINKLRGKRSERGLSQGEIAKKLGCSEKTYGEIERGNKSPTVDTAKKISNLLGVRMGTIFDIGDEGGGDARS